MNTTVSVEPNYARIFDYLIHDASFQPNSALLIEMLKYGKRLHVASLEASNG
jgi:hypothetical protein